MTVKGRVKNAWTRRKFEEQFHERWLTELSDEDYWKYYDRKVRQVESES